MAKQRIPTKRLKNYIESVVKNKAQSGNPKHIHVLFYFRPNCAIKSLWYNCFHCAIKSLWCNCFHRLCWGLKTCQPWLIILCRLPEKGRKETAEEMKETDKGRKRNRNESEETEEIKTFPLYPYLLQG